MKTSETYADGNYESDSNSSDSSLESETDIYVINLDGKPLYYQRTQEIAMENMWRIVNVLCTDVNYNFITEYSHPDTIKIFGKQRFIAVSYDRLHHTVEVTKIKELLPSLNTTPP